MYCHLSSNDSVELTAFCVTVTTSWEKPSQPTKNNHDQLNHSSSASGADEELDLLFDPQLQCFYDPRTCKYYKLIM